MIKESFVIKGTIDEVLKEIKILILKEKIARAIKYLKEYNEEYKYYEECFYAVNCNKKIIEILEK